ncbi:MAG TPA: hypothetical protein ENJ09_12640 [Planctomycetes bacterium]|nr:hypothetical protein [Planctomycetota bacterium]
MPAEFRPDRRTTLASALALGLGGVLPGAPWIRRRRVGPPDLLLLVGDDIGWPDLEGDTPMPAFERLRERALVFRNTFSQPTGSPTAYTILSGRYPRRDGLAPPLGRWDYYGKAAGELPRVTISPKLLALPRLLKSRGYSTALFGKWNLGAPDPSPQLRSRTPMRAGFQNWQAGVPTNVDEGGGSGYEDWVRVEDGTERRETRHQTLVLRDAFLSWWKSAPAPRFAMVSFQAAHAPFHRTPDELLSIPFQDIKQPASELELGGFLRMKAGRRWPDRKRYLGMVQSFTKVASELIEATGDAVTLVTTDNGTPGRVAPVGRNQTRLKGTCYEGGIHVPLLALGPDIAPGERTTLSSSVDLFATLIELAGLDPAETSGVDSRSLVGAFGADDVAPRAFVYAESAAERVLRTASAKLRISEDGEELFRLGPGGHERRHPTSIEDPKLHAQLRASLHSLFPTR